MTKLGPEARALVAAGRNTLRPSAADRERVLTALRARIEHAAAPAPGSPRLAGAKAGLGRAASTGLVVGAALVGGLLWRLVEPPAEGALVLAPSLSISSALAARSPLSPPLSPPPSAPLPSTAPLASSAPVANPAPEPARGAGARSTTRGLAEEVALLSRAETELHAGRFATALRLLDDYERRFPRGTLMQEDVAARVQALCGLGRAAAAKSQLKRLAPGSPHASRARAACGNDRLD